MGDCSENKIANRLQHFYVIPTPAEGGEESRAIAKAKSETPRCARSDMNRPFSQAVVPDAGSMKDSGEEPAPDWIRGRNPQNVSTAGATGHRPASASGG